MKKLTIFLGFLLKSALSPVIYIVGALVGMLINVLQSGMLFYSWVPFIVPVFVQIFTRSWLNYLNRNIEKLLSISSERDELSFLCDSQGHILLSSGRPAERLKKERIDTLSRLFAGNAAADPEILEEADQSGTPLELHSPVLHGWFSIRCRRTDEGWMIWLIDVTKRRQLKVRLKGIDTFRRHIVNDLERIARDGDIDERTARLILVDGWRGVFIAVEGDNGVLAGRVYKRSPEDLDVSDIIYVDAESSAPVKRSRRDARVVIEQSPHQNDADWRREHPLHPDVEAFLGPPYPSNFANWHEGDYTVIAFDKNELQPSIDIPAMEGLVSTAHTVRSLIDMARAADVKFLQSVEGLSAAAEFSDEITGKHIHRVNVYAETLARYMGLDENRVRWLGQVAAIHDIGKVAIPHIIKLDRKLSAEERREMEMHTIYGYQILQQMMDRHPVKEPRLVLAAAIGLNHHQHWDGSGYPRIADNMGKLSPLKSRHFVDYKGLRGLRGTEIPIEALIVSLADKYDALRSVRQYKRGFTHKETLAILTKDDRTGKNGPDIFGPVVWEAFGEIQSRYNDIYERMKDEPNIRARPYGSPIL